MKSLTKTVIGFALVALLAPLGVSAQSLSIPESSVATNVRRPDADRRGHDVLGQRGEGLCLDACPRGTRRDDGPPCLDPR